MGSFPVTVWIECGNETCDDCSELDSLGDYPYCDMYHTDLDSSLGGQMCYRCAACLAAEKNANEGDR